jgi:hypothetical protein
MRKLLALASLGLLLGCGSAPTPAGKEVLVANVEQDLKPDQRRALIGILHMPVKTIAFPDGQGSVDFEVIAARGARFEGEKMIADLAVEPAFVRTGLVKVRDAAGCEISAEVVGNPENVGTADAPIQARLLKVTRRKSGLFGSSVAQMTVRASPRGVERL